MASFRIRIEDIIGSVPSLGSDNSSATDQAVTDALTDTAAEIFNMLPDDVLLPFAVATSEVATNPVIDDIEKIRILEVERKNGDDAQTSRYISCKYVPFNLKSKVIHPESIYFATKESPVWLIKNKDVEVYPSPSGGTTYASNHARAHIVSNPTVVQTDSNISIFPNELEHVVVLGASARLKQRQISFFNDDEDSEVVALHRAQYQELQQKYQDALAPFLARGADG
tara:strand:- start:10698 stop:11375 length:678 start_codon:yes stop_codon:yes gene_type:complete